MPAPKNKATGLFSGKKINKSVAINLESVKENKKIQSFMIEPKLKEILKKSFEGKGLTWGAGLRMIIIEYMKKEKLIK